MCCFISFFISFVWIRCKTLPDVSVRAGMCLKSWPAFAASPPSCRPTFPVPPPFPSSAARSPSAPSPPSGGCDLNRLALPLPDRHRVSYSLPGHMGPSHPLHPLPSGGVCEALTGEGQSNARIRSSRCRKQRYCAVQTDGCRFSSQCQEAALALGLQSKVHVRGARVWRR